MFCETHHSTICHNYVVMPKQTPPPHTHKQTKPHKRTRASGSLGVCIYLIRSVSLQRGFHIKHTSLAPSYQVIVNFDTSTEKSIVSYLRFKKETSKKSPTRAVHSQQGIHVLKNANALTKVKYCIPNYGNLFLTFNFHISLFVLPLLDLTAATYDSTKFRNL